MRIDDVNRPNIGQGPQGPGGPAGTGAIGGRQGRVAQPGEPRLTFEPHQAASAREPLQNRPPFAARLIESCTQGDAAVEDMDELQRWLGKSECNVNTYVDGILMSALLREVAGE